MDNCNTNRERREEMEGKLTLSVEEAAKLLGIGRNLCYDRVKTGEIPVIKIGRRLLVPRSALEKLLANPKPLNPTPAGK
jgi:excisionase family DNA binding protein